MKTRCLLRLGVWGALSVVAPGVLANPVVIEESVRVVEGGQALLAIETHRAAIINRLLADYAQEIAQRTLDAEALRSSLNALRADQLLAATLVSTLDEALRVADEPMLATGQRYVAITPSEAIELRAMPQAQAYLVREGEALSVVKAGELHLTGRNQVVGYFTVDTSTSVTTIVTSPEKPATKDGSGSGANSWIGYTAGGNQASGTGSAVAAGTNNVASGQNAFVGAGTFNAATAQGAFVGGGTSNVAAGISSLVIGGFDNQARVIDALVVAGAGNRATGARSAVVGGGYNLASGQWSFIGGGGRQAANSGAAGTYIEDNVAAGDWSTIGGGKGNRAGSTSDSVGTAYSTVGGGSGNQANGGYSTVAGGQNNTTGSNLNDAVGGGGANHASGGNATVPGGFGNTASGYGSTVAGGQDNSAGGSNSIVAGGAFNIASGNYSFAAGHNVLADEPECAVFGFFSSGVANCKGIGNIIRVMGEHGFSIDWGPPTGNGGGTYWVEINDLTPGRPINAYNNAYLSAGGTWTSSSDRNGKEHFVAVNPRVVLAKLVAVPITQWSYKAEPGVRRMGPVAQDFHAAFGLGPDELTIAQTDEAGVAFAAIQGLNAKVEEQASMIAEQQHEIADLRERISVAERLRGELAAVKAALIEIRRSREITAAR